MGLGLFGGGVAAARFLARAGASVTVTDLRPASELAPSLEAIAGLPVELRLGGHQREDFSRADIVVANPAVAPGHELLQLARESGARVTTETELFLERCPARIAAVTGTQGKSSTCNLLAHLLMSVGVRTHLGGNIGKPLLGHLDAIEDGDVVVYELSSYQLEWLNALPPGRPADVVGVTNVLADHIERHGSSSAYAASKRRILDLVGDAGVAFLPLVDEWAGSWEPARGRCVRFGQDDIRCELRLRGENFVLRDETLGQLGDLRLPGEFQQMNALLALGMARTLGTPAALGEALRTCRGLEHRLEDLGVFAGHRVWDNGVSTTPDSTIAALRSLSGPLVLLCGGQAKRLDYTELAQAAASRARLTVTFGASGSELVRCLAAEGAAALFVRELPEAVQAAFRAMEAGDSLLFSPACASFDAFSNFAERARSFRRSLPG
jgi:UDP-N-acetylmuramoylalanine--D-glutamate ligase